MRSKKELIFTFFYLFNALFFEQGQNKSAADKQAATDAEIMRAIITLQHMADSKSKEKINKFPNHVKTLAVEQLQKLLDNLDTTTKNDEVTVISITTSNDDPNFEDDPIAQFAANVDQIDNIYNNDDDDNDDNDDDDDYYYYYDNNNIIIPIDNSTQTKEGLQSKYYCPEGYTLSGKFCFTTLTFDPIARCPKNFIFWKGHCVLYKNKNYICPEGYILKQQTCVYQESIEPTYACPEGTTKANDKNYKCLESEATKKVCPKTYIQHKDGTCKKLLEPIYTCPEGYELNTLSKKCTKEVYSDALPMCADTGIIDTDNKTCIYVKREKLFCPLGSTYDEKQHICTHKTQLKTQFCPKGFTIGDQDTCIATLGIPAKKTCPENYYLKDNLCIYKHKGEIDCDDENDIACEKPFEKVPVCPPSTKLTVDNKRNGKIAHLCLNETITYADYSCAKGYSLINETTCEKTIYHPPRLSCTTQCYNTTITPIDYYCPLGTEYYNKTDNTDPNGPDFLCVKQDYKMFCTESENLIRTQEANKNLHGQSNYNQLRKPENNNLFAANDEGDDYDDEDFNNFDNYNDFYQKRTTYNVLCIDVPSDMLMKPIPYCSNGGTLHNNTCIAYEPILPKIICRVGTYDIDTGLCEKTVSAKSFLKCRDNEKLEENKCIKQEFLSPTYECPLGKVLDADNDNCISQELMTFKSKAHLPVNPIYECQKGYLLTGDGTKCVLSKPLAQTNKCPEGTKLSQSGECEQPLKQNRLDPQIYTAPVYYDCKENQKMTANNQCVELKTILAESDCPEGAEYNEPLRKCVHVTELLHVDKKKKYIKPKKICPEKSILVGESCIYVDTVQPTVSCPPDTKLYKDNCVLSTNPDMWCPKKMIIDKKKCTTVIKTLALLKLKP